MGNGIKPTSLQPLYTRRYGSILHVGEGRYVRVELVAEFQFKRKKN